MRSDGKYSFKREQLKKFKESSLNSNSETYTYDTDSYQYDQYIKDKKHQFEKDLTETKFPEEESSFEQYFEM